MNHYSNQVRYQYQYHTLYSTLDTSEDISLPESLPNLQTYPIGLLSPPVKSETCFYQSTQRIPLSNMASLGLMTVASRTLIHRLLDQDPQEAIESHDEERCENDSKVPASTDNKPGWLFGDLCDLFGQYSNSLKQGQFSLSSTCNANFLCPSNLEIDFGFSPASKVHNTRARSTAGAKLAVRVAVGPTRHDPVPRERSDGCAKPCQPILENIELDSASAQLSSQEADAISLLGFQSRLVGILPMNTTDLLYEDSGRCIGTTTYTGHPRCKRTKNERSVVVSKLLENVGTSTKTIGDEACIQFVRDLLSTCFCSSKHKGDRELQFERICQGRDGMSPEVDGLFLQWITALISAPTPTQIESTPRDAGGSSSGQCPTVRARRTRKPAGSYTHSTKVFPTRITASALRSSPRNYMQKLEPFMPKYQKVLTTSALIRRLLQRPLKKTELKSGYIYMYWFPGNFGALKIGQTCQKPEERLEQWRKQCKHGAESTTKGSMHVKHVCLVEKMMQVELREKRRMERHCQGCKQRHIEWFAVDTEDAMKVLAKFAVFMDESPFECIPGEKKAEWRLRDDISEERIDQLCQEVKIGSQMVSVGPKLTPQQQKQQKERRRSSRISSQLSSPKREFKPDH